MATPTYISSGSFTHSDVTSTATSANIGSASSNRLVIVMIGHTVPQSRSLISATIAGISATIITSGNDVASTSFSAIIAAEVPTGTSGDIVLTFSSTIFSDGVYSVYTVDKTTISSNTSSTTVTGTDTNTLSNSYTSVNNGFTLGIIHWENGSYKSPSISGYTTDNTTENISFSRTETSSASQTATVNWTGNYGAALSRVTYSPATAAQFETTTSNNSTSTASITTSIKLNVNLLNTISSSASLTTGYKFTASILNSISVNATLSTGNSFTNSTIISTSTATATITSANIYGSITSSSLAQAQFDSSTTIIISNKLQQVFQGSILNVLSSTYTPTSNKLQLLSITTRNDLNVASVTPTISGNNLTWELVGKVDFDTDTSSRLSQFLFRALGASPVAGTLYVDFGTQTQTHVNIILDEISNIDYSGINGSNAIVQYNTSIGTSTTPNTTLNVFSNINNSTYASYGIDSNTGFSAGNGFQLKGSLSSFIGSLTEFKIANSTNSPISLDIVSKSGGIAVELKAVDSSGNALSANINSISTVVNANLLARSLYGTLIANSTISNSLNTTIKLAATLVNSITTVASLTTSDSIHNITSGSSNTSNNFNVYINNPTPYNVFLLSVSSTSNSVPSIPTITDLENSWTQVHTIVYGTYNRLTLFICYSNITNSRNINIDFSTQIQEHCTWNIDEISNILHSGFNSIEAVLQNLSNTNDTLNINEINTVSLNTLANTNNRVYAVHTINTNSQPNLIDSNYILVNSINNVYPSLVSEYSINNDNIVDISWNTPGYLASIAIELVYNKINTAFAKGNSYSLSNLTSSIKLATTISAASSASATLSSNLLYSSISANPKVVANFKGGAVLSANITVSNTSNITIITKIKLNGIANLAATIVEAELRVKARLSGSISINSGAMAPTLATSVKVSATIVLNSTIAGYLTKLIPDYNYISSDIQRLDPSTVIDLYEVDTQTLPGGGFLRFHAGVNELMSNIIWQGNTYIPYPIDVTGFEYTSEGATPRPKITISNISGLVGALAYENNDLIGLKVTRKRTFKKYLDRENFLNSINPSADPNAHFIDEIYFIDRKVLENKLVVEFELASALDLQGITLPRRQVLSSVCTWKYRSAECGYTGGAVATATDTITTDINLDRCGKRLISCKYRFGTGILPFGGFPAVGKIA